jgi:hypothetical protein
MDIVNKADRKKFGDKVLRFSIHELVPAPSLNKENAKGKHNVNVNTFHPIQECPNMASFDEEACVYQFPTTKLLSSEFDQRSSDSLIDRKIEIRITEVY